MPPESTHKDTIDIAPVVPDDVTAEPIEVQEGSWEYAVGARDTALNIVRRGKRVGIVFLFEDVRALAADGHERYRFPKTQPGSEHGAIWWLLMCNQLVREQSPKYQP